MDIGSSSSFDVSSKGGASDSSLNGLKFGKKIYFEDVGFGVSTKSGVGSTSISVPEGIPLLPPSQATAKKGRGIIQGGQPPRCQVEGCQVDLSGFKAYYSRHKVCAMHSKSPEVIVAGIVQRFCQQCSRFHQLPEFDKGKRSCRRRLAGHNERRRKPQPGSLLSSRYGRLSASLQEDSSRGGGFLMDFSAYPRMSRRDVWPTTRTAGDQPIATGKFLAVQWQSTDPPANVLSNGSHSYMQGSSAAGGTVFSSSRIPPEDSSRGGGFLMDFAACPRMSGRDVLPIRTTGDQPNGTGKFLALQWPGVDPPPNYFSHESHNMQGSSAAGGAIFSSSRLPPGECFAGVSDSSCALSLLSNQSWCPRNNQASSSLSVSNLMNDEGAPLAPQSTTPTHGAVTDNFTVNTWGFKGTDEVHVSGSNSHELHHGDLGLGQISSQPMNNNDQFFSGELDLARHVSDNREYMELARARAYEYSSTH